MKMNLTSSKKKSIFRNNRELKVETNRKKTLMFDWAKTVAISIFTRKSKQMMPHSCTRQTHNLSFTHSKSSSKWKLIFSMFALNQLQNAHTFHTYDDVVCLRISSAVVECKFHYAWILIESSMRWVTPTLDFHLRSPADMMIYVECRRHPPALPFTVVVRPNLNFLPVTA